MKKILFTLALFLLLCACGNPVAYRSVDIAAPMFPDYADVTIPYNIAPLDFSVDSAEHIQLVVTGSHYYKFDSRGSTMRFNLGKWHRFLEAEKGRDVIVNVRASFGSRHLEYRPFTWTISTYPIDRYMSYRLIEPAYEMWNVLSINERCLENFDERELALNTYADNSCINCHTSNRAGTPSTFMHVRGPKGGTIYCSGDSIIKINTKTESTAGGVYGELDSTGRYGIFTTAVIVPILHSQPQKRLEVYDSESDLVLYDFKSMTATNSPLVSSPDYQETFPCLSADNRTIYFARAKHLAQPDSTDRMHYDLYSIGFDPSTGKLGDSLKLVFDASSKGLSVSFPKCSRDGRKLLFCVSQYGTFPIWHPETDIWMLDLATGSVDSLKNVNSNLSDTYHCWSGNSRWFVFASKRSDGMFGRPYISFVPEDGTPTKPFLLPQKDPGRYLTTFKSFNIPELYDTPEKYDASLIRKTYYRAETRKMKYVKR